MADIPLLPPRHRVERRAIGWWALRTVVTTAVLLGVLTVPYLLFEPARWLLGLALAIVGGLGVAHLAVTPWWRYAVHRWEVTDDAVYVRTGWFVREWRIAPLSRELTTITQAIPGDATWHPCVNSRSNQAEGFAAAPQGNVTQASHKHVTKQNRPFPSATNTFKSGEADQ